MAFYFSFSGVIRFSFRPGPHSPDFFIITLQVRHCQIRRLPFYGYPPTSQLDPGSFATNG
ncbi:hypothetical protein HMPREF1548_05615 [Clostridium sp. KLE 1755]|nr:hypothetical protein HMPREF1548_05615 [Clostridium sp. KLE 1755]